MTQPPQVTPLNLDYEPKEIRLTAAEDARRLDAFLAERLESFTRAYLQRLIREERVLLNGAPAKASARVRAGDETLVKLPPPRPSDVPPEPIPLDVLYEDDALLVINKPKGLMAHPTPAKPTGTLVNALLHHCAGRLSGISGVTRPGIVHRLDKDTSGVMVVAKNDAAHAGLSTQMAERRVEKRYTAIVHGKVRDLKGRIETRIGRSPRNRRKMAVLETGGKDAITEYAVVETFTCFTHLDVRILTGRTHQVRVHMAHIGHPVAGDPVYGGRRFMMGKMSDERRRPVQDALNALEGQALHARYLAFTHPATEKKVSFEAPLPRDIEAFLMFLKSGGEHAV